MTILPEDLMGLTLAGEMDMRPPLIMARSAVTSGSPETSVARSAGERMTTSGGKVRDASGSSPQTGHGLTALVRTTPEPPR